MWCRIPEPSLCVCICVLLFIVVVVDIDTAGSRTPKPQALKKMAKPTITYRTRELKVCCLVLAWPQGWTWLGVRGRGNEGKTNTWTHRHRKKLKSGGLGSLTEKDQRSRSSVSVACVQLDKEAGLADFCRRGLCRGSGLEAANIQEKAIVGVSVDTVYMYIWTPGAEG